jgi:hypothetical protein
LPEGGRSRAFFVPLLLTALVTQEAHLYIGGERVEIGAHGAREVEREKKLLL